MALMQFDQVKASKHPPTDEWLDANFTRPLASVVVRWFARTPITANQVTLLSGICGVAAALSIARTHHFWPLLGGLFLLSALIFDCADGQLARCKGTSSEFGRVWDGTVDWIVSVSIHFGLLSYLKASGFQFFGVRVSGVGLVLVVAAAGLSMALHCMLFDYHKGRYAKVTGGNCDVESCQDILARAKTVRSFFGRVCHYIYWVYAKFQASVGGDIKATQIDANPDINAIRRAYMGHYLRFLGPIGPAAHLYIFAISAILAGYTTWGFYLYISFSLVAANVYWVFSTLYGRKLENEMNHAISTSTGA